MRVPHLKKTHTQNTITATDIIPGHLANFAAEKKMAESQYHYSHFQPQEEKVWNVRYRSYI